MSAGESAPAKTKAEHEINNKKRIYFLLKCSTIQTGERSLARPEKLHKPEPFWLTAIHAAESKQARDIVVLDLRDVTSFADYFILCSGANSRQVQAIADEVQAALKPFGEYAVSVEGYTNAEWVLVDFGDYLVHVFSEKARTYYDLERLWRDAKRAGF